MIPSIVRTPKNYVAHECRTDVITPVKRTAGVDGHVESQIYIRSNDSMGLTFSDVMVELWTELGGSEIGHDNIIHS